jgi:DNA-binding winged helix-turn-helix (wHTH) protein/tetratricopeptide (TPR) repeat protein
MDQAQVREFDRPVRLASVSSFRLSHMDVAPSRREVCWGENNRILEPRVMQVLVVLAEGAGQVVGRDELISRCWDGRVVGDNAINRVISVLRQLAADSGGFRLETVTKVGYRLVPALVKDAAAVPRERPGVPRRALAATAAGAAIAAAAGIGAWRLTWPAENLSPEANAYLRDGRKALEAARPEQDRQAVAYFQRATELAPRSADAWAALALALVTQIGQRGAASLPTDVAWVVSASDRALELDPHNGEAETALLLTRPRFGNWTARDQEFRLALARHPRLPPLISAYANFLTEVGRWRESASRLETLVAAKPMIPAYRIQLAAALWGAERLADADRAFAEAVRLFPAHNWAWTARFDFLMLNGRPAEAIASADDPLARPAGAVPMPVNLGLTVAGALKSRQSDDVAAAMRAIQVSFSEGALFPPKAIVYLAGLGALDESFAIAQACYLKPANGIELLLKPPTFALFGSATKRLRADPRYPPFVQRLGFEKFWRESGVPPDFRRT